MAAQGGDTHETACFSMESVDCQVNAEQKPGNIDSKIQAYRRYLAEAGG